MIGNPGAGKSTLLNSILKKIIFESGVSIGTGKTFQFDAHEENGTLFMDTPGLSDISKRQQAAEAITLALKQRGYFKVFFVLTLESGRLRPDDLSLIKIVLESATDITSYSLILNQVNKAVRKRLSSEDSIYKILMEAGITKQQLPKDVHIVDRDEEIECEDNKTLTDSSSFLRFVEKAIPVEINPDNVANIRAEDYDQLRQELVVMSQEMKEKELKFDDTIKAFIREKGEDRKKFEELKQKHEEERQKLEKNELERQRLQSEQRKMKEEMEKFNSEQERLKEEFNREQERLKEEINLERQRNAELASLISDIQQKIVDKENDNTILQSKINEVNESYIQEMEKIQKLEDNDAKKAEQIVQLEFQRREDQNMIAQYETQIRTNTDEMGRLRRQINQMRLPCK